MSSSELSRLFEQPLVHKPGEPKAPESTSKEEGLYSPGNPGNTPQRH